MYEVGSRVGAILSIDGGVVRLLGYGVYEGDHLLPGTPAFDDIYDPNGKSQEEREITYRLYELVAKNPRIKLDNGEVVWGRECWWGPEERVKEKIAGATDVVMCRIIRNEKGICTDVGYLHRDVEDISAEKL